MGSKISKILILMAEWWQFVFLLRQQNGRKKAGSANVYQNGFRKATPIMSIKIASKGRPYEYQSSKRSKVSPLNVNQWFKQIAGSGLPGPHQLCLENFVLIAKFFQVTSKYFCYHIYSV